MHESLPLAYFGTALACGAFAYDAIAARCGTAADELSGRMPVALVVCAGIATVTLISYVGFLGFPAAGNEVLLWGGIVACGMLGTVAPALVRLLAPQVPALPADVAGLLCAVAGGVSVRHGLLEPVRPYRSQRHAESLALWRAAMLDGRPPLERSSP